MINRIGWVLVLWSSVVLGQAATRDGGAGYKREKELTLPGAPSCDYLSINAPAKRLLLAHGTAIDVIDLVKGEKTGEVAGVNGAHGAIIIPALKRGFATAGKADRLVVFDPETLKVTTEIETGKNPDALLFVAGANEVWAMNGRSQNITCVQADSLEVKHTIVLEGKPEFAVQSRDLGKVFVNLEDKNAIAVVDVKEHKVVARYPLTGCEAPTGLALDAEHGILFAGCNKKLAVVDAGSGAVLAAVEIGEGCDAVVFDPGTKLAFASCADGTTTLIHEDDVKTFTVAGKIQTAPGAKTCALDIETHKLYLAVRPRRNEKGDVKLLIFAPEASK